jgi:hypothetical protein
MFPLFCLVSGCSDCVIHTDAKTGRPVPVDFEKYIPFFLQDNPDESCAKAGHASYGQVCTEPVLVLFRKLKSWGGGGDKWLEFLLKIIRLLDDEEKPHITLISFL